MRDGWIGRRTEEGTAYNTNVAITSHRFGCILFKVTQLVYSSLCTFMPWWKPRQRLKLTLFSLVRTYLIIFGTGIHPRKKVRLKYSQDLQNVSKASKGGTLREHTNAESNSRLDSGRSEGWKVRNNIFSVPTPLHCLPWNYCYILKLSSQDGWVGEFVPGIKGHGREGLSSMGWKMSHYTSTIMIIFLYTELWNKFLYSSQYRRQGLCWKKIEGSPVFWTCGIQGAQHVICTKNENFLVTHEQIVSPQTFCGDCFCSSRIHKNKPHRTSAGRLTSKGPQGAVRAQPW